MPHTVTPTHPCDSFSLRAVGVNKTVFCFRNTRLNAGSTRFEIFNHTVHVSKMRVDVMSLVMERKPNTIAAILTFLYPFAVRTLGEYLGTSFKFRQDVISACVIIKALCSVEPNGYLPRCNHFCNSSGPIVRIVADCAFQANLRNKVFNGLLSLFSISSLSSRVSQFFSRASIS